MALKHDKDLFLSKGMSASDVYYINHDKRKEMEAKIKLTGKD